MKDNGDDNNNNTSVKKYAKNKKKGVNCKAKIMLKYFIKYNILFAFKVMVAITYYIVISLVESSKRVDYLSFDSITNSIEGIHKSSFNIFLNLKIQLSLYKPNLINTANTSQSNYNMSIPSNDNISTLKLGNLLMPLVLILCYILVEYIS